LATLDLISRLGDPVKPEAIDFFPSSSENIACPVPGEIFKFYSANLWLPRSNFYIPSIYLLGIFEKGKTAT